MHQIRLCVWVIVLLGLSACSARRTAMSIDAGAGAKVMTHRYVTPDDESVRSTIYHKLQEAPKSFDKPKKAMEFYVRQRALFGGSLPVEAYLTAQKHIQNMRERQLKNVCLIPLSNGKPGNIQGWHCIGPGNIGGRTRALIIHPTDHNTMIAGGVSGGVWKTTDGGMNWVPLNDFMPNLAVCSLAMDPVDPSVIYLGTGEGYYPVSSPTQEELFLRGLGIFKTNDGGNTWTHLSQTVNSGFYYVNDLKISSANHLHIFAATQTGVWRSLDGGQNWTLQKPSSGSSLVGCTELAMRTDTSPPTLFAAFGSLYPDGLYRSTDNGDTWIKMSNGFAGVRKGRIALAIAPSDQNRIYACVAQNVFGSNGYGALYGVWRSMDGGDTWEQRVNMELDIGKHLLSNPIAGICFDQGYSQGWYDEVIAVDPINPDIVWVGGVDLQRSDDGGVTWGLASAWWQYTSEDRVNFCHADIHRILFHPDFDGVENQTLFVGSDGGIYRCDNARADVTTAVCSWVPPSEVEFTSLNHGYATIQYYHGDVSRTSSRFIGGAQDNGSSMVDAVDSPEDWREVLGGDGGYCAIDHTNPDIIYAEWQNFPQISKSMDGGITFHLAVNGITNDTGAFIVPFAMDPTDPLILWTGGQKPWRTTNGAELWVSAGADFNPGGLTSAVAIAPSDSGVVYFGFSDGYVHRTSDGLSDLPMWSNVSPGLRGGNGYVSWITVHPTETDIAYVTYSTFGGGKVFRTVDGGEGWADITGSGLTGLPDLPVHCLAVNPNDTDILYVGTDLGVFISEDGGETWIPDNAGMPHTTVENFAWQNPSTLVAFTYGRSVFRTFVCGAVPGDFDCDGRVGVADLDILLDSFGENSLGDLDGDGDTDALDLAILLSNFSSS